MTPTEQRKRMDRVEKMLEHFEVRWHHRKFYESQPSPRRSWLRQVAAMITNRKWRTVTDWNMDSDLPEDQLGKDSPPIADLREANIVTSEDNGQATGLGALDERSWHLPTLDIDVPVALVPSTSLGHYHLFFDVHIEEDNYWRLLDAMAAAGIVQEAWVDASKNRGYSAVRMPWIAKQEEA